jgi:ligand-binding SRPBCC domain-containing protein
MPGNMPLITLDTKINAPAERCFYLSLSVDLHKASTAGTNEEAIAGVTSGLMKKNDRVTWRAKHFGIVQHLTTVIPEYDPPHFFISRMVKGTFKKIEHKHIFNEEAGVTTMRDEFLFEAPMGILGQLASALVLTRYMRTLLEKRNDLIKRVAESEEWKKYLEIR